MHSQFFELWLIRHSRYSDEILLIFKTDYIKKKFSYQNFILNVSKKQMWSIFLDRLSIIIILVKLWLHVKKLFFTILLSRVFYVIYEDCLMLMDSFYHNFNYARRERSYLLQRINDPYLTRVIWKSFYKV